MYSELNNQRRFPVCEKIEAPYRRLLCPFFKKKNHSPVFFVLFVCFFFQLGLTEKKRNLCCGFAQHSST